MFDGQGCADGVQKKDFRASLADSVVACGRACPLWRAVSQSPLVMCIMNRTGAIMGNRH